MSRATGEPSPPLWPAPSWRTSASFWWFAAGLVGVTFIAYSPALRGGWIWDDDYYVTRNLTLRSLHGLWRIWTDIGAVPQYYPLTHTTFWLEWRLWADDPTGYHIANVLLHCASSILVGLILRRLEVPGWWIVPWLFALHPVHVESVAWVTERKNVLSGLFYLLALNEHLKGSGYMTRSQGSARPETGHRKTGTGTVSLKSGPGTVLGKAEAKTGTGTVSSSEAGVSSSAETRSAMLNARYWLALALFVCALLSKSVTSSLPAVILLIIYWKRGRVTIKDVVPLLPFFALGAGMGMLTSWMERHIVGAQGPEWEFSILDRGLIAGRAVWFYATKLIWPHPLIFMYERWAIDDRSLWQYAFPVSAIGVVVAQWGLRHRLGRGPLVAVLFFGGTLIPALGFVNVLPMRYAFVADHFQYLASLGLLTLFAAAVATHAKGAAFALTIILSVTLAAKSWSHAHDFTDLETLWQNTLAKNRRSWMVHNNYGTLLMERGDYAAAAERFHSAIALKPDHDQARLNLGQLAERQGDPQRARAWYLDALRVRPGFANALYNLANLAASQGRDYEAITYYERAIASDPGHEAAHINLGITLARRGELHRAVQLYRRALEINPDSVSARINLGNALLSAGHSELALAEWAQAAAIDPRNPTVRNNLGAALASQGRYDDAEREFRAALAVRPDHVDALTNLGIVRARRGDFAGARQYLIKALALDPGNERAQKNLDALPSSTDR